MTIRSARLKSICFEATSVPRFDGREDESLRTESLCAQRTFWSGIQELLSSAHGGPGETGPVVELRISGEVRGRRARIFLIVRSVPEDSATALNALWHALPPNYGWKAVEESSINPGPDIPGDDRAWQIVPVHRRLNFVDLPFRSILGMDDGSETDGQGSGAVLGSEATARHLVSRFVTPQELYFHRYCLPVTGTLEVDPRSLEGLFETIRSEAPCAISMSIGAVDSKPLNKYRQIAKFWSAGLEEFHGAIANAGVASAEGLRYQFDKFLLPDRFLCALTMRTAARTPAAAQALALRLTARLGGFRSFKIHEPLQGLLDILGDPWLEAPHDRRWSAGWWTAALNLLHERLAAEGIDPQDPAVEPSFKHFLIALPHVHTIDEASAIASLPMANEKGLPGVDTRLIAPFSEPSRFNSFPRGEPLPADRIRVGLSTGH